MPPRVPPKRKRSAIVAAAASDLFDIAASKSSNKETKELEKIDKFFSVYANPSMGMIDPDGIEKLCSDIKVDHTDVRILMLAWKMQSEKQGYFTLEEWRRCLKPLCVNTVAKLKKAIPEIEKEVRRPSNFVQFYSYAFKYCLTEEKQKSIDIDTVCQLLDIVLGSLFRAHADYLIDFLKEQTDYKAINMDQWVGFYRFCNEISFPDMSNYDADMAWPLILDNFAAWMKAKQK
ncbi:hypothetical protein V2J09_004706 [Rumex salicifolius]